MTSSYTTNYGLEQPTNGSYSGNWNLPVNADWATVDSVLGGTTSIPITISGAGSQALTSSTSGGAPATFTAQWQATNLVITGAATGAVLLYLPSGVGGSWSITNATTGGYAITFGYTGSGASPFFAPSTYLPVGQTITVVGDGANCYPTSPAGGLSSQIQFNSGVNNILNGSPYFKWSTASNVMTLGGAGGAVVGLKAPATGSASVTYTLPSSDGTSGQVLSTNGSGALSWATAGGGSSGVTSFSAGSTGLTPNTSTTGIVTLGGTLASTNGGTGLTSFTSGGAVYATSSITLTTGTLPITAGGTGATTASGALANLGAASLSSTQTWTGSNTFNGNFSIGSVSYANNATSVSIANPSTWRTALSVPSSTGSGASGTWGISISGNAATATSATSATSATTATTATTANALNASNSYSAANFTASNNVYCAGLSVGTGGIGYLFFQGGSGYFGFDGTQYATGGVYNFAIGSGGYSPVGWFTVSDYRGKTDVADLDAISAISRVQAIRPVTYTLLADGKPYEGFIAHELAEVVPCAVVGQKDALKADGTPDLQSVDVTKIIPLLVAAIKELKAEIDALKVSP